MWRSCLVGAKLYLFRKRIASYQNKPCGRERNGKLIKRRVTDARSTSAWRPTYQSSVDARSEQLKTGYGREDQVGVRGEERGQSSDRGINWMGGSTKEHPGSSARSGLKSQGSCRDRNIYGLGKEEKTDSGLIADRRAATATHTETDDFKFDSEKEKKGPAWSRVGVSTSWGVLGVPPSPPGDHPWSVSWPGLVCF